jgi:hypothetical protein
MEASMTLSSKPSGRGSKAARIDSILMPRVIETPP